MIEEIKEEKVSEIFKNNKFEIPIYQRNYAWEKEQIDQLLEDIEDNTKKKSDKYYIGNLIVKKIEDNKYSVIDGQQRLTTLFLLQIILNSNNIPSDALKFEVREKSNETFKFLFENSESIKEEDLSEEILNGYNIIKKYFKNKTEEVEFLKRLENVILLPVEVPKKIDLNHYFEVMNTRGEQLELHEIAKSKFLGKIEKNKGTTASLIWDACADMSSYVQMNFKKQIRENLFDSKWSELIEEIDSFESIHEKIKEIENKSDDSNSLEYYMSNHNIKGQEKNKEEDVTRFESIIKFPIFLLQVARTMSGYEKIEDEVSLDDKKLLSTLEQIWSENAEEFLFRLLKCRLLFDKYIIKREFGSDDREIGKWSLKRLEQGKTTKYINTFTKNAENLKDNEEQENMELLKLQSCLRITYTSPKTMHWIHIILSELINAEDKELVDITNILENYCKLKTESSVLEKTGFNIDRIVFTYLDYILWKEGYADKDRKFIIEKKQSGFDFIFRNSVEHFFPQHPENDIEQWDDEYLNCFGNLGLLTVSTNSKLSNAVPEDKIGLTKFRREIEQSIKLKIMENETDKDKDGWTKEKAKEHGKNMIDIIRNFNNNIK
ncbi:MAG: DUF262 domain-containing HNH endonuclease family protein [bacterium]